MRTMNAQPCVNHVGIFSNTLMQEKKISINGNDWLDCMHRHSHKHVVWQIQCGVSTRFGMVTLQDNR